MRRLNITARLLVEAARWRGAATCPLDPAAVVAAVQRDRGPVTGASGSTLATAAEWHRVGPALGLLVESALTLAGPAAGPARDRSLVETLARHRQAATGSHLRSVHTLKQVAAALTAVPWVAIKGPVLALLSYPRPDLRWYSDLDVVVVPEFFAVAVEALEALGFVLLDRDFGLARDLGVGQLHLRAPNGTVVDLHHDVTHRTPHRMRLRLPVEVLLDDRSPLPGVPGAWCPQVEASLIHLCVHAASSGADRLGWFADVHHTVSRQGPDWSRFLDLVAGTYAAAPCALMLDTSRRLLGTPVPDWVGRDLLGGAAGAGIRALGAAADGLDPVPGRRAERPSPARVLARGAGGSKRQTAQGVALTLGSAARRRLAPEDADRHSVMSGPGADPRQRAAYLTDVVSGRFRPVASGHVGRHR